MNLDRPDRWTRALDLLVLAAVPLVLVAVYLLPVATRRSLALAYHDPTLPAAYAMHFVHLSADHLLANLLAYLLIVPLAYALAVRSGERDLFVAGFVTVLGAFPFALSALNLALSRPGLGYGFSGLNMAFLGLLPLVVVADLRERAGIADVGRHAPGLFLAGLGLVAALAVPDPAPRVALTVAAFALAVGITVDPARPPRIRAIVRTLAGTPGVEFPTVGALVVVLVPLAAFPADPASGGVVTNLYSHLLGFCLGFLVPYATRELLDGRAVDESVGPAPPPVDRPAD